MWLIRPHFHIKRVGKFPRTSPTVSVIWTLQPPVPSPCSATGWTHCGGLPCFALARHSTGANAYLGACSGLASPKWAGVPRRDALQGKAKPPGRLCRLSANETCFLVSTKARTSASIILRGANDFMCDEMERSSHDALCVVKRVLESKSVVPGGGAVEAALSIYLENYATSMVSREQLAIAEFARSLLVIPNTLAVNAAQDSTDLVAKLRAFHNEAQVNPEHKNLKWIGLDLSNGKPRDNKQAGVFEPTIVKVKSLKFATEAAITILRIDDLIKLHPESKDDKYGSYEDAVHSGALND
ncbi:T-complex protein 1 subunit alpha-like [Saimiri boliviensis]|uniref:T-complex protein 1 subunit alpha-like n=1 Tax=Saimiri boliviensis TaxID=27679 RepID=UPI003D772FEE